MRTKLITLVLAVFAVVGLSAATSAPAQAGLPVKAGKDNCGNFNVWVNGEQLFYYLHCGPDWD